MARKIVNDVNEDIWRMFAGKCKMKNVIIGEELTKVLEKYLENEA